MKKPILVTDHNLKEPIETFCRMFPETIVYDSVTKEPDSDMITAIQKRMEGADSIVALGGGSPMDAAKAARGCSQDGNLCLSEMTPLLPLIAIPTTAGTGSEVTPFSVITTAKKEKQLLKSHFMTPSLCIIDPVLTYNKPAMLTACTGVDALCHALEAFVSRRNNPYSDGFAINAMYRIGENIIPCVQDPTPDARANMMLASTQAGIAFSSSSVTLVHGMSRPLGRFNIGHGMANAQLLSQVVRFSHDRCSHDRYNLAKNIIFKDAESRTFATLLHQMVHYQLRIPTLKTYLNERGMLSKFKTSIPQMVDEAFESGSPQNNPRIPTEQQVADLYLQLVR